MTKIAYLIIAHENPQWLHGLLYALLTDKRCGIFVHIDKCCDLRSFLTDNSRVHFLSKRLNVKWAGFSMVQATWLLYLDASQYDYDYYCLLSGSDFPLTNPETFSSYLSSITPYSLIESAPVPKQWGEKGLERTQFFLPELFKNRSITIRYYRILRNIQRSLGVKRTLPGKLSAHCGSSWWCLSSAHMKAVSSYVHSNPGVNAFFSKVAMPDEQYFQTILESLCPNELIRKSQTFVQWDNGIPRTLSIADMGILMEAQSRDFFFCRKIGEYSSGLTEALYKKWS